MAEMLAGSMRLENEAMKMSQMCKFAGYVKEYNGRSHTKDSWWSERIIG